MNSTPVASKSAPSFTLSPAEKSDIPRLAHIHVIACLPDNAIRLIFDDPKIFERRVTEMLQDQIGDPCWHLVKAIDNQTGVLAAWASWNTPTVDDIKDRDAKLTAKADYSVESNRKGGFDFPPGLGSYVQAHSHKFFADWTQGRRHILCKALFTDPQYQRRGMGNAMVAYGNHLADKQSLPILLQGTPFGYPIYAKHEFKLVDHLDVDLDEWAPDAQGSYKGWHIYRYHFMLRLPRTIFSN